MEPPELLYELSEPEIEELELDEPGVLTRLRHDYALLALIIATLLINFGLIAFLIVRYDALPDPLPLHFDASGLPDRIDARSGIIALPLIGFIVLSANALLGMLVYRHERGATLLLLVGALCVQLLMWLAMINAAGGLF